MKYIIVKARNQYIQKNNKALKQKLNEFEIKKRKVQQNNEMIKKRIHTSNSIRCVLNKIQNNQEEFDENFAKKITSDMSSPSRIMDFEKNFEKYNKLKPYKKYTNEIQRTNYSQPKEIDLYSSPSHSNVVRHRYHPSSKIFYLNINEKKEIGYFKFILID